MDGPFSTLSTKLLPGNTVISPLVVMFGIVRNQCLNTFCQGCRSTHIRILLGLHSSDNHCMVLYEPVGVVLL